MLTAPVVYLGGFGAAVFVLFFFTSLGLGLSPDSVSYLKGASGLISGEGWSYVSAQWPPLYPLLVAIAGFAKDDVIFGARAINALCLGINLILIAILVSRLMHCKPWQSLLIAGLVCLQPSMTYVHFYAWSEPTLLVLILTDLLLLSRTPSPNYRSVTLIALIFVATLAVYTRFAGLIVAATNCAVILLVLQDVTFWVRLRRALLQLVIPVCAFYPWLLHQGISDGAATARTIEYHPVGYEPVTRGLMTMGRWLIPQNALGYEQATNPLQLTIGLCILIVMAGIAGIAIFRLLHGTSVSLPSAMPMRTENFVLKLSSAVLFLNYVIFLIAALSFVDSKVALDNRILVLIFPVTVIALLGVLSTLKSSIIRAGIYICAAIVMLSAVPGAKGWLLLSRYGGIEMNSRSVVNSELQTFIRSCPKTLQVYADHPWNFDLYFQKKVLWLASETLYNSGKVNSEYQNDIKSALSIADLIIVQNTNSDIVHHIDKAKNFTRAREQAGYIIWQKAEAGLLCV